MAGEKPDKSPFSMKRILLITGSPGSGKTTLLSAVSETLARFHPSGFLTMEIREGGMRKGFLLKTMDGEEMVLAHSTMASRYRVGRYGVDIAGFDCFLKETFPGSADVNVFIIDEIGKMECLSVYFRGWISEILEMPVPVIATISLKGDEFIETVKKRDDVQLLYLTPGNRDIIRQKVLTSALEMVSGEYRPS